MKVMGGALQQADIRCGFEPCHPPAEGRLGKRKWVRRTGAVAQFADAYSQLHGAQFVQGCFQMAIDRAQHRYFWHVMGAISCIHADHAIAAGPIAMYLAQVQTAFS